MPKDANGPQSKRHLVDMSLPPGPRKRKKTKRKKGKGVIAQMDHANGKHFFDERRRKWEKDNSQRGKGGLPQPENADAQARATTSHSQAAKRNDQPERP
jgi:hypothetical protein